MAARMKKPALHEATHNRRCQLRQLSYGKQTLEVPV